MYKIELAQESDINELTVLLGILFSQDIEFTPEPEKQERGLRMILNDEKMGHIVIMREGNEIIGMVNILYTISTALGEKVAILEDMIIKPAFRGKGLGTELLLAGIKRAEESGCKRITLLTDFDNEKAIAFYKKQGFTRSAMIPLRKGL